jgi:hypothetical protein
METVMEESSPVGGRYSLIEMVGEGATKQVFRASDPILHRDVAVCRFKEHMLSSGYLAQVRREGQTLAGLNHPNIVAIYDFRDDDGVYMVTEFMDGGSLKERLTSASVEDAPLPELLRIAAEAADALSFTHDRGVFHRDVKPSNVMLTLGGTAKLADFGMAKPFNDDTISRTGVIEGTIPYMSPEQAKGERPDSPTDIYSLGIVLYELVAQRRPFHGEDVSVLVDHLNTPPPPPTRFSSTCPMRLEDLILRMLDKDASGRPTAKETAEQLRLIRSDLLEGRANTPFIRPPPNPINPGPGPELVETNAPTPIFEVGRTSGALQHPITSISIFATAMATLAILAKAIGLDVLAFLSPLPLIVLTLALVVAVGSFSWRFFIAYDSESAERIQELVAYQEPIRRAREEEALQEWHETLRRGFTNINSQEGIHSLEGLSDEFIQLREIFNNWPHSNLVALGDIPPLSEQTYRQGLDILNNVLELLNAVGTSNVERLKSQVRSLEREVKSLEASDDTGTRLQIRRTRLHDLKERLTLIDRQGLRAEEFLLRANLMEGALHKTRMDLNDLKIDGASRDVDEVRSSLQNTIDQALGVLDEMRELGY